MPYSIAHSICQKHGPTMANAVSAGVPEKHPFATKPQLARLWLTRALDARMPAAWVTGASVDGHDRRLRVWWEEQDHASVMAFSG
jgi:hypothetical protein